MFSQLVQLAGPLINQSLSAAIAVIAGSFFLYSLVKDIGNRIARVFSLLMFFVLVTYIGDLGVSMTETPRLAVGWLRFQWLGIAFVPAVYVHLSHAILSMTGLDSRGRRLLLVRLQYAAAAIVCGLVWFSDFIVTGLVTDPAPHFRPGPLFFLFGVYFVGSVVISMWFLLRARRRTLTEATRRRMNYLLVPFLAPALAVFPFLLISGRVLVSTTLFYGILILVDAVLAVMLSFMAYAMAFMGSLMPDRMIKAQMLQFFLRGPVVAIAVLAVIVWVPKASAVLGLPGDEVMPLLAVALILSMQWAITLLRPYLERWLIYGGDQQEIRRIQELEERLLTGADFRQTLDTILMATCDYARVASSFVASFPFNGCPRLERFIGPVDGSDLAFENETQLRHEILSGSLPQPEDASQRGDVFIWRGFWLIPLRVASNGNGMRLVGLLGVSAPDHAGMFESDRWDVLMALASRATEVLEDRRIQSQVFASLEGLLPEMTTIERLRDAARHGGIEALAAPTESLISNPDFTQRIKDALGHYWGGPRLTEPALLQLAIYQKALRENDENPQRAMRAVLEQAIESLRPEGQRSMTTAEWILYNILEMRFIQGRKVRDVAMRLAMSESDLYRKQRVAIEAVSAIIADMERETHSTPAEESSGAA
jgi:hypothetical protein